MYQPDFLRTTSSGLVAAEKYEKELADLLEQERAACELLHRIRSKIERLGEQLAMKAEEEIW